MRLARLNLTRYGKFTDFALDFGPREPGKPDFHIVYGPNEAGKTTTLSAYLDLLFGIEKNSVYKFLHGYDVMQVGGVLECAGGARELVRIKKAANSMLDGKGQVVSESFLAGELGGLDRNDYRLKFSLDADTLETGGDNILASKGDLGELLFAASAGVADLSQKLGKMREDTESFFRKGTRKNELAELKGQIKDLDDKKQEIDTLASRYAKLVAEKKEAADLNAKALKDREAAVAALTKIQRLQGALPRLSALKGLDQQLQVLAGVPEAPAGWKEKLARLLKQETELTAHLTSEAQEIERLAGEIGAIAVDEEALGFADRLKDLELKKPRFVTAESDIPKLKPQVMALDAQIAGVLRVLERESATDPHALLLGASVTVALRGLIETWAGVETGLSNAEAELRKARETFAAEAEKLELAQGRAGGADPAALAALGAVVAELRSQGLEARRTLAHKAVAERRDDLAEKLKPLAPWRGEADDLVALRLLDATRIAQWQSACEAADRAVEDRSADIERLTTELTTLRATCNAFEATAGVVSDGEAARTRAEREAAWASHRRALSAETADQFEARLRADDQTTGARIAHATEAAQINLTLQTLMIREQEILRAQELHKRAMSKRDGIRTEIAAAIKMASPAFSDAMTLAELADWLTRLEKALSARNDLRKSESAAREAETALETGLARLGKILAKTGVACDADEDFSALIQTAQRALDEAQALKAQARIVEEAARARSRREAELARAERAAEQWKAQWKAECGRCWIAATHEEPSIALVREILTRTEELRPTLSEHAGLVERIEKMQRDQYAFTTAVATLARDMGEEMEGRPALGVALSMSARVNTAGEKLRLRASKLSDLEAARRREADHGEAFAACEREKAEVLSYFAVETLAGAMEKLDEAKARADLLKRRAEEERLIREALGAASIEEAEASLTGVDAAALSTEKAKAENQFDKADALQREYYLAQSNAEKQIDLIGGDEAVALIDERRRTICLDIEDRARNWLRLRTGVLSAELALRAYREKHRNSMLINASAAFSTISRGAYSRLTTQPEGHGEILVAVSADGGSKKASELSKGTRFQLYLALRVAGHREVASSRQPPSAVPFIADDIMETFDDFRAEEAFRLLADMAEVGQVIYLTHHEHLCAIAQKICPEVRIHKL